MTLAILMALPTLMIITGLRFSKQELSSVQLTEGSVSNLQQYGGLYVAKMQPDCGDPCACGSCDRKPLI
jgi:hypothetical protein